MTDAALQNTENKSGQEPTKDPFVEPVKSALRELWESTLKQITGLILTFIIGIATLYSGSITENIKKSLNRAEEQKKVYSEISQDIAEYVFRAENLAIYLKRGQVIDKATLEEYYVGKKDTVYNKIISTLRKMEYTYYVEIKKHWKKEKEFQTLFNSIIEIDYGFKKINKHTYKLPQKKEECEQTNKPKPTTKPCLSKDEIAEIEQQFKKIGVVQLKKIEKLRNEASKFFMKL